MADTTKAIKEVTRQLKARIVHPSGTFGRGKKFTATNGDRTEKYVTKVAEKFGAKTVKTILKHI